LTRLRSFRDDLVSPVDLGAAGMGIHAPPPAQRFDPAEDRASPRPDVLAVLETVAAGSPRDRITGVAEQLVWLLVHAHHRARRVVRTAVGRQDANAISLASTSPVTGEGTGGNSRSFRPIVAQASPPVSANRFEIRRTVSHETPTRAAITARGSTSPAEMSSASRTRARLIIDALRIPVVVTRSNASRSSTLNATGYFFCDDTTVLSGRRKREDNLPGSTLHPSRTKISGDTLLGQEKAADSL